MEKQIIKEDWSPRRLRMLKGIKLSRNHKIMKTEEGWLVPSESGQGCYLVSRPEEYQPLVCECDDFDKRRMVKCKHIWAVENLLYELDEYDRDVEYVIEKKSYPQKWASYDRAKTEEKARFMELLYELCTDIPNPVRKTGRPLIPFSDMIFSGALKVYCTFSLRRFMTDIKEAKKKGYIDKTPCFASVGHFFQKPEITQILFDLIEKSAKPLKTVEKNFAMDSSGFSTCRFDRWFSFKYGKEINSRIWIKTHLMTGIKTNIVTAVKLTEAYGSDTKQFPELMMKTAKNFKIKEVYADKAYLSRKNMNIAEEYGSTPYIPFKKNTKGRRKKSGMWKKMYHFFMMNNEEFMQKYHKRSNVESTFHMVKSKFGDSLRSKTRTAQINEILFKILCHNICVIIQEMEEMGLKK